MELNNSSSMSFGIEMSNGDMNVLIHKNDPIPIEVKRSFANGLAMQTHRDGKKSIAIKVFQGEELPKACENFFLGQLELSNIGCPMNIEVSFRLNTDDTILNVRVRDLSRKKNETGWKVISNMKGRLSKHDEEQHNQYANAACLEEFVNRTRFYPGTNLEMCKYDLIKGAFERILITPVIESQDLFDKLNKLEKGISCR